MRYIFREESSCRRGRLFSFAALADDGTFGRSDFIFDPEQDQYICPAGKVLKQFPRNYAVARTDSAHDGIRKYRAFRKDCRTSELKSRCCPNMPSRNVPRSVHEEARDHARQLAGTPQFERSRNERKKVEMLFAHLKTTMHFERMRLRGLTGAAQPAAASGSSTPHRSSPP